MGTIKDRNSINLREAEEIKERWLEYTEELWTEFLNIVQEVVTKTNPKKKKCKKSRWLSEETSRIAEGRREVKGKGERERYTQLNAEFRE